MRDEDEEIELIINNLLEIGCIKSYAMFHWGWRLAKEETRGMSTMGKHLKMPVQVKQFLTDKNMCSSLKAP